MKVYKLELEVDDFQSLLPADDQLIDSDILSLDGSSKLTQWKSPLKAIVDNEEALAPDIFSMGSGDILLKGKALEILKPKLVNAEFLPVYWSGCKQSLQNDPLTRI